MKRNFNFFKKSFQLSSKSLHSHIIRCDAKGTHTHTLRTTGVGLSVTDRAPEHVGPAKHVTSYPWGGVR